MYLIHVRSIFAAFYIRDLIVLANVAKIKRSRIKDGLQYSIEIAWKYAKMAKSKKEVTNVSKIWLRNGAKDNNTSSHMLLGHFCLFGLLLCSSGLKKKYKKSGYLPRPTSAPPWICPLTDLAVKQQHLCGEYFIHTEFHQIPSSGSREKADYVLLCKYMHVCTPPPLWTK